MFGRERGGRSATGTIDAEKKCRRARGSVNKVTPSAQPLFWQFALLPRDAHPSRCPARPIVPRRYTLTLIAQLIRRIIRGGLVPSEAQPWVDAPWPRDPRSSLVSIDAYRLNNLVLLLLSSAPATRGAIIMDGGGRSG